MARRKSVLSCNKDDLSFNGIRIYNHFSMLARNRFKWENLPTGIESRHIEKYLYEQGQVAFYNDEKFGLICLPCSTNGGQTIYGDPTGYTLTGIGYSKQVNADEVVRILNNDLGTAGKLQVIHYSNWLSKIEGTMYINLNQQKFPYIIPTTKNNELTMKNVFNKMEEGEPCLMVDERLTNGGSIGIEVMKTEAPYLLDKLQEHKDYIMNELLSWLGLNNTDNKKERLLVDEVNVNNSHILMNLDLEFKNRQLACDLINEKFGLNITVSKVIDELELDFMGQQNEEPIKKKEVV
ncbi:MAG: hypothetical protein ACRCXT_00700 [Paraclostridium sp.]